MLVDKKRTLIELCAARLEDCLAGAAAGADRIELNSALPLGGLTPSLGTLLEVKRAVALPLMVMARPRPGGFCYSRADFQVLRRDVELALEHGADGIVFGVLQADGSIDMDSCRQIVAQAQPRQVVFHRAFDVVPDPHLAIEQLIDLGLTRVITSGQQPTAEEGAPLIAELIQRAAGRIEILPAGRIIRTNAAQIIRSTGCNQVHVALRGSQIDRSTRARSQITFGSAPLAEDRYDVTDAQHLAELRTVLDQGL